MDQYIVEVKNEVLLSLKSPSLLPKKLAKKTLLLDKKPREIYQFQSSNLRSLCNIRVYASIIQAKGINYLESMLYEICSQDQLELKRIEEDIQSIILYAVVSKQKILSFLDSPYPCVYANIIKRCIF